VAVIDPPDARREAIVDHLHGHAVADPYRWLEDDDSSEVAAWVAAQNATTRRALDARGDRDEWLDRLGGLLRQPISIGVRLAGDRVFSLERGGGQKQFTLCVRPVGEHNAVARTLIDPVGLTADGTGAIDWYHPSVDGRLVAYGTSEGGDERSTLRVLDVDTGAHLADEIPDTRAASVAWAPDGSTFFYSRHQSDAYHRMIYRHELGQPWSDDELVWGDLPNPEAWPEVLASADGRFLLVTVEVGWARTDVHLYETATGSWRTLVAGVEVTTRGRFDGDRLVAVTTLDAPRGRVVAIPLDEPVGPDGWTVLVPEGRAVLQQVEPAGDSLLVVSSVHASSRLAVHDRDGAVRSELGLPELGSVVGLDTATEEELAFVQIEGFTRPASLYVWRGDRLHPWADAPTTSASPAPAYAVSRETYVSTHGTEVGLFLVHRADTPPDPTTACILTGYGGFGLAEAPTWSPLIAAWAGSGGLVAIAGLRGGLEEGEAWHEAGRREHKQNVFDDFHAAADHLVATGLTSRSRLAIRGGSNGGLLVGAALTQRPDLCRAVHCAVPLLDMVRYPQFLIARLWTDEYGDPEVAEELAWLLAYSPYHHVVEGTCYPAVLLTTAEGDSRVAPLHARKMAAALQHATSCSERHPILLSQEERAGHGQGKPLHKQAEELADVLSFFTWQLSDEPGG